MTVTREFLVFLYSLAAGCALGLYYDVFRILRKIAKSSAFVLFLQDLLFMLSSCAAIILFIYHTNSGRVRFPLLFGICSAFFLYRVTIGETVMCVSDIIISLVKKTVRLFLRPFAVLLKKFSAAVLYHVRVFRISAKARKGFQ